MEAIELVRRTSRGLLPDDPQWIKFHLGRNDYQQFIQQLREEDLLEFLENKLRYAQANIQTTMARC